MHAKESPVESNPPAWALSPHSEDEQSPADVSVPITTDSKQYMFDMNDGDVELQVNDTLFKTRRYLINKFTVLRDLLSQSELNGHPNSQPTIPRVTVQYSGQSSDDFKSTFKILYASVIEGPFEYDTVTLASALRVATTYNYPALRTFCISGLEKANLSAIQRIKIAQELGVTPWLKPAYEELCNRDQPITPDEARILGVDGLLKVSNMREQRRKNKATEDNDTGKGAQKQKERTPARPTGPGLGFGRRDIGRSRVSGSTYTLTDSEDSPDEKDDGRFGIDEDKLYESKRNIPDRLLAEALVGTPMPGVRVHIPKLSSRRRLEVALPGCTCTDPEVGKSTCECRIPPCLFRILRMLQTEQANHAIELETAKASISSLSEIYLGCD